MAVQQQMLPTHNTEHTESYMQLCMVWRLRRLNSTPFLEYCSVLPVSKSLTRCFFHRRSSPFAFRTSLSSLAVHFRIRVVCISQLRSHLSPLASSAPCSDPVVVPHQLRLLDAAFASSNLYVSLVLSHGRRANDKLVSILSESDRIETQLVVC